MNLSCKAEVHTTYDYRDAEIMQGARLLQQEVQLLLSVLVETPEARKSLFWLAQLMDALAELPADLLLFHVCLPLTLPHLNIRYAQALVICTKHIA